MAACSTDRGGERLQTGRRQRHAGQRLALERVACTRVQLDRGGSGRLGHRCRLGHRRRTRHWNRSRRRDELQHRCRRGRRHRLGDRNGRRRRHGPRRRSRQRLDRRQIALADLAAQLGGGALDQLGIEGVDAVEEGRQQRAVGQAVQAPRHAAGPAEQAVEGGVGEGRTAAVPADMAQPVLDIVARLRERQRPEVAGRGHALAQLLHRRRLEQAAQLRLADQEALQQRMVAELEVRQHAQFLDSARVEVLRLVHDQQRMAPLRRQRGQEGLQRRDQVRLGAAGLRRNAEGGDDRLQQLARLQLGADDLRRQHLLAVQPVEQHAHQRGLARADLAGDDDEALGLRDAVLQVGQRAAVAAAVEVERRIRVELEGRAAETEVGFVHRGAGRRPAVRSGAARRPTGRSRWRRCRRGRSSRSGVSVRR